MYLRMSFNFFSVSLAALVMAVPGRGLAQDDAATVARRIAAVSSIAADEYALGVAGGRVISEAELTEARLFLGEARDAAAGLPEPVRTAALDRLARLLDHARTLGDPGALRREASRARVAASSTR